MQAGQTLRALRWGLAEMPELELKALAGLACEICAVLLSL